MAKKSKKKAAVEETLVPEMVSEADLAADSNEALLAEISGETLSADAEDSDLADGPANAPSVSEETSEEEVEGPDELLEAMEAEGLPAEEEGESFLPDAEDDADLSADASAGEPKVDVEGTELDSFESAEIEETEFVEDERVESIIESILFASDRPVGLGALKLVFKGTNVRTDKIKRTLDQLAVEYAGGRRGVTMEEVPGGWQLRTKIDNMDFLRRTLKTRAFRLSGPALEVLSIVAYKQPMVKHELDEIRGVESGHLLRALMEKNLVTFVGKSDLPGRPMQYGTTRRFLEIFGLRNLKELPTLSQIDELLPEGIGEEEEVKKPVLADVTDAMSEQIATGAYSTGEEELQKIQDQLEQISTSSEFFEREKIRQREERDKARAQDIRDAMTMGELVPNRDVNWLKKYDEAIAAGTSLAALEEAAKAAKLAAMKDGAKPAVADAPMSGAGDEAVADATAEGETAGEVSEEGPLGAEAAGEAMLADDEESLIEAEARFEEDAPHPEDELGEDIADIDGEEGEGHAGL